jgi:2-oxoglutarate dehydrogenase E2 component (EC 2.3.1.61)
LKVEIRVPPLSESLASGTLLAWRKQVGEPVARDETLVDLETDKVILEIPAAASGTLIEIRAAEGAEVKSDQVVAVIETTGEAAYVEPVPAANPPPAATQPAPVVVKPAPATAIKPPPIQAPSSGLSPAPKIAEGGVRREK